MKEMGLGCVKSQEEPKPWRRKEKPYINIPIHTLDPHDCAAEVEDMGSVSVLGLVSEKWDKVGV